MYGLSTSQLQALYDGARKWFTLSYGLAGPITFFIDAPFGRFTPTEGSLFHSNWLIVDGIKSWIIMEIVSPMFFLYTFANAPFSGGVRPALTPGNPLSLLVGAYLLHYLNRAIISPLHTPSRSKSHIIAPAAAVAFNTLNGSLLGAFLSSLNAPTQSAAHRTSFWVGMALWLVGFVGNVVHDEILLNLRRKAKSKGKDKNETNGATTTGEHYAIPYGLLYRYISYPNYFCEWVEWLGFAIAADPRPLSANYSSLLHFSTWTNALSPASPASAFFPLLSPPWIFLVVELATMYPRAYRGHQWYLNKFGESYPKERKIVIPFLY
ncbi:S5A-REDUCTASE domain-containing protein [Mycena kentingensis (nom. inval.)]|nr:S5A-REDUCTASE domain-containing protein [Mycena kentingensis (nom. inval.)]